MFGERLKISLIHICFLAFYICYCAYQLQQWANISHSIDLISYLDIGDAYWRGDFQSAINNYWSPLYSVILGAVLAVFRPGIDFEMLAVRLTNLALMLFLAGSLIGFARALWQYIQEKCGAGRDAPDAVAPRRWLSAPLYWCYMYSLLCFAGLCFGGVDKDTPDVLLAALVLLASTGFVQLKIGLRKPSNLIFLGSMLGLGYLAKAVILPISVFYYVAAWWEMRAEKRVWKNLAVIAVTQFCFIAPFIVSISLSSGHLTFSDVGRGTLWADGQDDQQVHFQFPELKHKSNIIFENPTVYEFSEPIRSTYPPWYNPAYWTEGASRVDLTKSMLAHFVNNGRFFALEIFSILFAGWLLALLVLRRSCITLKGIAESWTIALPAVAAFLSYAVIVNLFGHMMERYFVPWFILFYSASLLAVRVPDSKRGFVSAKIFLVSMSLVMMLITVTLLGMHYKMTELFPYPADNFVAHKARELGLAPGDKIAQLGFRRYYWARLARLRIVADIFDLDGFWAMSKARREELIDVLRRRGVKALIMTWYLKDKTYVPQEANSGWVAVPPTKALIYIIPPAREGEGAEP